MTAAPRAPAASGTLHRLVLSQWPRIALAVAAGLTAAALALVPFLTVYRIVAAAWEDRLAAGDLLAAGAVTLAAILAKWGLRALASEAAHAAAYEALYRLRIDVARALAVQPLGAVQAIGPGRLKKILYDDIEALEVFLAHHVAEVAVAVGTPLLVLGVLVTIDWRLALAAGLPVLGALVAQAAIYRGHGGTVRGYHDAQEAVDTRTAEYVRSMPTIKVFARGERALAALRTAVAVYERFVAVWAARWFVPGAIFAAAVGAGFAATVAVGAWLLAAGRIDVAGFALAALLADGFAQPVMKLLQFPEVFSRLAEGERRVAALVAAPRLPEPAMPVPPGGAEVRFDGVGFGYGETAVLSGIAFTAAAGRFTAIVGPSGAGKSTLLRLIARFWDVSHGSISIGGTDLRMLGADAFPATVSLMQQATVLFDGSILDNIRMARPGATDGEVAAAVTAAGLDGVAARLPDGLATRVGDAGARLSGGERQRVGLARTILHAAPVVLLDEPTAYADTETEAAMHRGILTALQGRTLIVAAHRLSTIAAADRIVVMDRGRIADQGSHADLLDRCPLYADMWRTSQAVRGWRLGRGAA